jgi:hypothetical protein
MSGPAEAKAIKASNVFLDTEVFVEANFGYKSPRLASVAELAGNGRIRVFLTELTVREMKANIKEAIERAAATRPHPILRNSSLPQVTALFEPLDTAALEKELVGQLEDFIKGAGITLLPIEDDFLGPVLDNYFDRLPPFGPGKNKAEFPDALALQTLKEWCRVEGRGMAVVTRDEGVKAACSYVGPLFHFENLPKYLDAVASEDEAFSSFIREMVVRHDKEVFKKAKEPFPNLGFYLTDEDGDVGHVELTGIEYEGDVEIISLTADEAIIEMPATLTFAADVSYYVPGTGSYDSEDDVLLFEDTAESTVTRTAHRSVAAEVTFEDLDPESFQVHGVWFEGKSDIGVKSDYDEDWPYK